MLLLNDCVCFCYMSKDDAINIMNLNEKTGSLSLFLNIKDERNIIKETEMLC